MDSVFLDSAEQQTVELLFPAEPNRFPAEPNLFVGELLDWAERFALEEAPRLIQDGGKSGVISFLPVLDKLRGLVRRALLRSSGGQQDPAQLPAGYRTARVQRALQELADHLDDAFELASQIRRNGAAQARAATP
jgi:hypothetical protein